MLVFTKENLVILAVPKTGTTALHQGLESQASAILRDPPGLKHMPVQRYQRFMAPLLRKGDSTPELLAVIRNPVDWLGSWYRYRSRNQLVGHPNSTRGISFDDFVLEYLKGKPASFAKLGAQSNYVFDQNGERATDHLFAYEDPPRLHAFLESRLNTRIILEQKNVSPPMSLTLSDVVREKLQRKCLLEFDVWNMARG